MMVATFAALGFGAARRWNAKSKMLCACAWHAPLVLIMSDPFWVCGSYMSQTWPQNSRSLPASSLSRVYKTRHAFIRPVVWNVVIAHCLLMHFSSTPIVKYWMTQSQFLNSLTCDCGCLSYFATIRDLSFSSWSQSVSGSICRIPHQWWSSAWSWVRFVIQCQS